MDRIPFQATAAGARYESVPGLPVAVLLDNVRSMYNVGAFFRTCDAAGAGKLYQAARTIREKLDPNSLLLAASLNGLGNVAWSQGDLGAAKTFHLRALEIQRRSAVRRRAGSTSFSTSMRAPKRSASASRSTAPNASLTDLHSIRCRSPSRASSIYQRIRPTPRPRWPDWRTLLSALLPCRVRPAAKPARTFWPMPARPAQPRPMRCSEPPMRLTICSMR